MIKFINVNTQLWNCIIKTSELNRFGELIRQPEDTSAEIALSHALENTHDLEVGQTTTT